MASLDTLTKVNLINKQLDAKRLGWLTLHYITDHIVVHDAEIYPIGTFTNINDAIVFVRDKLFPALDLREEQIEC